MRERSGRRELKKKMEGSSGDRYGKVQGVRILLISSWKEVKFDAAVGEKQEGREIERKFSVNLQDKRKLNGNYGKYEV